MKCDIILDLLPLYVEDLCRPESKKAVTEHLDGCENCRNEYQNLLEELLPDRSGDTEIEKYLEERDLFQKSRSAVRDSLLSQGGRVAGIIVFITALLCNIGMFLLVIRGCYLRYPALKLDESAAEHLWILVLPLLPTAVSLIAVITSRYKKKNRALRLASRTALCLLVPSVLIGALYTAIFLIMPPLCSRTDNPGRYLVLDTDMERYSDAILQLFPEEIPEQAENVAYHYQKYSALFSDTMTVECSFRLPGEAYQAFKDKALAARCFKKALTSEDAAAPSAAARTVTATVFPEGVDLEFSFDDETCSIRCRAGLDKSN